MDKNLAKSNFKDIFVKKGKKKIQYQHSIKFLVSTSSKLVYTMWH
jgi:hypothetical protein